MGCQVTSDGVQQNFCVIDNRYNEPNSHYFFNHLDFFITYRNLQGDAEIVFVEVVPRSINHLNENLLACDREAMPQAIGKFEKSLTIFYTYSVFWKVKSDFKHSHQNIIVLDDNEKSGLFRY